MEAEKILQEKKFSKPPPEKEKSELEKHEEKLNYLFGEKEINNNMVGIFTENDFEFYSGCVYL